MAKESKKVFDLKSLEPKETATLELRHPADGTVIPGVTITGYGKDSKEFERAQNSIERRRTKKAKNFRSLLQDPEDRKENEIELLARVTTGWTGIVVDGEEVSFSFENAKELYGRFAWIREQFDEFLGDRTDFLPNA